MKEYSILNSVTDYALQYLNGLGQRRVYPDKTSLAELEKFSFRLPESSTEAEEILGLLNQQVPSILSPQTVAAISVLCLEVRLPASLAANWLASAWDQNAVFKVTSPIAAHIEKITTGWLLDLLGLPSQSAVGFVTGTTMANFCGAVAARYQLAGAWVGILSHVE